MSDGSARLFGGARADEFHFGASDDGTKVIGDYKHGTDTIHLDAIRRKDVTIDNEGRDAVIRALGIDDLIIIKVKGANLELSDLEF